MRSFITLNGKDYPVTVKADGTWDLPATDDMRTLARLRNIIDPLDLIDKYGADGVSADRHAHSRKGLDRCYSAARVAGWMAIRPNPLRRLHIAASSA